MWQRLRQYYQRHGFKGTLLRFAVGLQRLSFAGKNIVFVCELPVAPNPKTFSACVIERNSRLSVLTTQDVERIVSSADSETNRRRMVERFAAGAELWLIRCEGIIAAFGWTIQGRTMKPHFLTLTANDVHLFDFFVFPEFRGRGLNPALVNQILQALSRDNLKKAIIETAAWNEPQLASLKKTPFRRLGAARKLQLGKFNRTFWSQRESQV